MATSPRVVTREGGGLGFHSAEAKAPGKSWEASAPLQHAAHGLPPRRDGPDHGYLNCVSPLICTHFTWSSLGLAFPSWASRGRDGNGRNFFHSPTPCPNPDEMLGHQRCNPFPPDTSSQTGREGECTRRSLATGQGLWVRFLAVFMRPCFWSGLPAIKHVLSIYYVPSTIC